MSAVETMLRQEIDTAVAEYKVACAWAKSALELELRLIEADPEASHVSCEYVYKPSDPMADVHRIRAKVGYLRSLLAQEL